MEKKGKTGKEKKRMGRKRQQGKESIRKEN